MVDPTIVDAITASSSLVINLIGIIMGFIALKKWKESRESVLLYSSILFFTLPNPWFVDFVIYTYHILNNKHLAYNTAVFISAISIPILSTSWIYITSTLYRRYPQIKWSLLGLFVILNSIFYVSVYILKAFKVTPISGSALYNIDYLLVPNLIILIYGIFGLGFIFPSYLYFSIKSDNDLFKLRSGLIAAGSLLFTIAGVSDALLVFDNIFGILFLRMILLLSMSALFIGFVTPKFIRDRYNQ